MLEKDLTHYDDVCCQPLFSIHVGWSNGWKQIRFKTFLEHILQKHNVC